MALDLTNIEDVKKAIFTPKIENTTKFDDPAEGEQDDGDQEGDHNQSEQEGDGESEDESEGEGEGESEGEPEPIPLTADEDAVTFYIVKVWQPEHLSHTRPDRVYIVQAEYPAQAIQAAETDAQTDLGPDLELFGIFQPPEEG